MAFYSLNYGAVPSNTTVPFHSEHCLSEFKINHHVVERVESTNNRSRISFTPTRSVPQEQADQLRMHNPPEGVACQPNTPHTFIYSSPTKALCSFYQINNTVTMSPTNVMDFHPVQQQAPLQLETLQDNHSVMSPLQCGSIIPVAVHQTIQDQHFNLPYEIIIRVRVPISMEEQQAESDQADSYHRHNPPISCTTKRCDMMETKPVEPDEDNQSEISSLQVGSVLRIVAVAPDTHNQPMNPPQEITIRLHAPITIGGPQAEDFEVPDWLRVGKELLPPFPIPTLRRGRSVPQQERGSPRTPTGPKHVRIHSCPIIYSSPETAMTSPARSLIVNGKVQHNTPHREDKDPMLLSKARPALIQNRNLSGMISVGSIVGKSSFHTVLTENSSSRSSATVEAQGYYQHLQAQRTLNILNGTPIGKRRSSIVRSELKYVWNRVSSPLKQFVKEPSADFTRASGCLT
jgi:hypothetical protein